MRSDHVKSLAASTIAVTALFLQIAGCVATQSEPRATPEYPRQPFTLESAPWGEPYNGPLGIPRGAQRAVLWVDPVSNGDTYYARFTAGTRFEPHWHAYAEYAVVLRGQLTHVLAEKASSLKAGDYVVIPPKVNHGWEVDPGGDAYLLIRRDGPADTNFVAR